MCYDFHTAFREDIYISKWKKTTSKYFRNICKNLWEIPKVKYGYNNPNLDMILSESINVSFIFEKSYNKRVIDLNLYIL